MSKQILLINDMAGYGKVALSAMIPVLSHMKHHIYNLPTALVSNTLDYGKFDILETTDYMANTMKVWDELGFSFDAVSTGFIVSERQEELVAGFCEQQKARGTMIFVDPIMGDEGKLYNGVTETTISHMRRLIGKLLEIGAKSIVITSAVIDRNEAVIVYDYDQKKKTILPFTSIPVRFPGTGDIFSSVFMGKIMEETNLVESTQKAMDATKAMIAMNRDNADKFKGIPLESCLEVLD